MASRKFLRFEVTTIFGTAMYYPLGNIGELGLSPERYNIVENVIRAIEE